MVKTLENTMGSLVNSVKPMAHTHSSFLPIKNSHMLKKKQAFSHSDHSFQCHKAHVDRAGQPPIGSHNEATSIIKAGVFTGAEN